MPEPTQPRAVERVAPWQPPDLRTLAAPSSAERPAAGPTAEEAGYARGWQEGRADLLAAGETELTDAAAAHATAARALKDAVAALQARFAESVQLLAVGIAWHLVEREFASDPMHLHGLVQRALVLAPVSGPVTIRLHPADLDVLRAMPNGLETGPAPVEVSWVADSTLHRAGCLLEGPGTVIDGRIDRALLDTYERLAHE